MKRYLASSLLGLLLPLTVNATPISWDFTSGILQPLQSAWTALVRGNNFVATSTTATSTFPNLSATSTRIAGSLYDSTNSRGTNGYVLQSSGSAITWVATSSLGITGGSGHNPVTLSGSLDYITLVGQDIVRGAIDLATDITGVLSVSNGGTGLTSTSTILFENEIETESELELFLTDVTNVFTNNDGALNDDDLTDNQIDDLSDVAALSETTGDVLSWNGSAWADVATSTLGFLPPGGALNGTFDGLEGMDYLARANHTGTQLATTISDFVATVRSSISETIDGIGYDSGTGIFSLDAGREITKTASSSNWNTFYDTPSTRITAGTNLSWSGNTLNASGGGGGGTSDFTFESNFGTNTAATTTGIWAKNGIYASSTSRLSTTTLVGNLAIGTTSPREDIIVQSSIPGIDLYETDENQFAGLYMQSGNLRFYARDDVSGTVFFDSPTNLNAGVTGNLLPTDDDSYSLGNSTRAWYDVWLGTAGTIAFEDLLALVWNGTRNLLSLNYIETIQDSSFDELISFSQGNGSAVNNIHVTNALTGVAPIIAATSSSDSNVGIVLAPKGSGSIGIGSTSPTRLLSVSGDAWFNGSATATNITATGTFRGAGLTDCDADGQTVSWDITTGTFGCGDDDNSGGGGSGSNWSNFTGFITPSTTVGITVNSSSTIDALNTRISTTTSATTTNFFFTNASGTDATTTRSTIQKLFDATGSFGSNGQFLTSNGSTTAWASTSTLAYIMSLNGITTPFQGFASSSPSSGGWGFSSSGFTHTLSIPAAGVASPYGLLSSSDWSTFNSKESALTFNYPLSRSANTISFSGLATTTPWTAGQVAWAVNNNTVSTVATGTLTETVTGLELDATRALLGGSAALSLSSGYSMFLTASGTNWNTFYDTPSTRITAGNHIDWTGNTLDVVTTGDWTGTIDGNNFTGGSVASGDLLYGSGVGTIAELGIGSAGQVLMVQGGLPVWISTTTIVMQDEIDTLAELETLQGGINIIQSTEIDTTAELETLQGGVNILLATEFDTCSEIAAIVTGETGTCGSLVLSVSPAFTGTASFVNSSTTVASFGNFFAGQTATTTITTGGAVGIGTSSPISPLSVAGNAWINGIATSSIFAATSTTASSTFARLAVSTMASVVDFIGTGVINLANAVLNIPFGTNPTVDSAGEIALDTTDDQLLVADSGGTVRVFGHDEFRLISTTIASSSLSFASGNTLPALGVKDGIEITQYRCYVVGGTSKVVNLTDGTNDTETITCGTTMTSDTDVATNDTFTADELGYIEFGATSGSVNYLHFEAWGRITRE